MKLRKNEMISPKSFFAPTWEIKNSSDLSFHSSEVSFDSSEVLFHSSEEFFIFHVEI